MDFAAPINSLNGSEVTITSHVYVTSPGNSEDDRPMTPFEIAETLAAMDKIEPFDMTDEERESADAWEKKVNDYTIVLPTTGLSPSRFGGKLERVC